MYSSLCGSDICLGGHCFPLLFCLSDEKERGGRLEIRSPSALLASRLRPLGQRRNWIGAGVFIPAMNEDSALSRHRCCRFQDEAGKTHKALKETQQDPLFLSKRMNLDRIGGERALSVRRQQHCPGTSGEIKPLLAWLEKFDIWSAELQVNEAAHTNERNERGKGSAMAPRHILPLGLCHHCPRFPKAKTQSGC